jgi:type II secretory pathway pseudopilin PulG
MKSISRKSKRQLIGCKPSREGWSLIEMLVVFTLMAILGSVGTIKFASSLNYHRVNSAARRLVIDINATQRQARITSQPTSVELDATNNYYKLVGVKNPDRPALNDPVISLRSGVMRASLGPITLTGGGTTIAFNGHGIPNKGGTITLQSGSATKQISVNPSSGIAELVP